MKMAQKMIQRLLTVLLAFILFFMAFYSLPYYVSKPGMAKELAPIVNVENGYEAEGSFMLTTIRMGQANIYSYLLAKFSDYQEIFPITAVRQEEETEEEYNIRQLYLMDSSKLAAIEVAYTYAGLPVHYEYRGVFVLNILENMPAYGKLQPGDRIFQVDDFPFSSSQEFIDYVNGKKEGEEITLVFERNGKTMEISLSPQPFPNEPERIGVGITLVDDKMIEVEPKVTVNSESIGGPSAGLMFALEIYNQLTEEDLTKGYQIAGTGTISVDGTVGRIGGVEQKVVAAHKAGADIFFAPNEKGRDGSNYEEALVAAEDIHTSMKIVPVDTFEEAVEYLRQLEPKGKK